MRKAEKMMRAWTGCVDSPDASLRIAAQQTADLRDRYKAPHAPRGTPPRRHRTRIMMKRLIRGHRK